MFVRLNTTYTPNGTFATLGKALPDATGKQTQIGYDAAICVETYQPWIVETYNSTDLLPLTTRIVSPGATIQDADEIPLGGRRVGGGLSGVGRTLNSTGKFPAFAVAHDNSVNQMVKVRCVSEINPWAAADLLLL